MIRHLLSGLAGAAALGLAPSISSGQVFTESICPQEDHAQFHACALRETPDPPRRADGRPDFTGLWRRRTWAFENFEAHAETVDDFGGPSVVVDPPDGIVPILPWAEAERIRIRDEHMHHNAACTLSGPAGTMYMTSRFQFLQDEQHVVMVGEQLTAHPYRIIPIDGRPHIGNIPLWNGDPRGRWEGDTLVIESPNHNAKYMLDQQGRFITDEAIITERLTRLDENTIHYSATYEDPNVFTQPMTMAFAFRRDAAQNAEIWEEACHETNTEQLELFRNNGYTIFPGITGEQARQLKAEWEAQRR
ncbi:MAG: hypothetical protein OEM78_06165 [Gammaproteobacteria bacterium]|nr:hypothetical protein [Gammaproteobacteria bacterium]